MINIPDSLLTIAEAIKSLKTNFHSTLDIIKTISSIVVALAALFGIYRILRELKIQKQVYIESQNASEKNEIQKKLNFFFSPLKALRAESRTLYAYFANDEKREIEKKIALQEKQQTTCPRIKHFRTLRHLTQCKKFSDEDNVILKEILAISQKQLRIIEREGYIVLHSRLSDLLGKLGAHIRLLQKASEHKLDGLSERLEDIVYPKEIDGAIESEVRRLQDRYLTLSKQNIYTNKLPKELSKSIAYYNNNSQNYFKQTAYVPMEEFYKVFINELKMGDLILDAGCGVGRDTRYFLKEGFRVVSIDASSEMVKICNSYPFAYCLQKEFSEIEYFEEFDGIWACASLIHLSQNKLYETLSLLLKALIPSGVIFFTLKTKKDTEKEQIDGRTFYFYQINDVKKIIDDNFACEEIKIWSSETNKKDDDTVWLNFLYRKIL